MVGTTTKGFSNLFSGVREVVLTDLPDHPNVGDSAIALGELEYFRRAEIQVDKAMSIGTLNSSVFKSSRPVVIHGGGNIGGLYEHHERNRALLAGRLADSTLLIQAPQSIDFVDSTRKSEFLQTVGGRRNLRIAVRDAVSLRELTGIAGEAILVPDAVHILGKIPCPRPDRKVIVIARTDFETASFERVPRSVDWPKDGAWLRATTRFRKHAGKIPFGARLLNPSIRGWNRIAEHRFSNGVELISRGEIVITDRLHAMLMGLQAGRQVVAVDNSNQKLSRYADAWFGRTQPSLVFAKSFQDAMRGK